MDQFAVPFPQSIYQPFQITSPSTTAYNCIAWAYGDDKKFYWPDAEGVCFWPANVPRKQTIEAFKQLYSLIGYTECDNTDYEDGFEKIVIYTKNGLPQHAARQIDRDFWTSKLGPQVDVSHSLMAMDNGAYGSVAVVMKRIKAA